MTQKPVENKSCGAYKDDFEHFLQDIHGEQYIGTDDNMPDDFNDWAADLSFDDWIEYADKYGKHILTEILKRVSVNDILDVIYAEMRKWNKSTGNVFPTTDVAQQIHKMFEEKL